MNNVAEYLPWVCTACNTCPCRGPFRSVLLKACSALEGAPCLDTCTQPYSLIACMTRRKHSQQHAASRTVLLDTVHRYTQIGTHYYQCLQNSLSLSKKITYSNKRSLSVLESQAVDARVCSGAPPRPCRGPSASAILCGAAVLPNSSVITCT